MYGQYLGVGVSRGPLLGASGRSYAADNLSGTSHFMLLNWFEMVPRMYDLAHFWPLLGGPWEYTQQGVHGRHSYLHMLG